MRYPSLSVLFASALLLPLGSASANHTTRPNIVVIMLDDQRWDSLGTLHAADGLPVSPGVAELAAEGVVFTEAYVTTALCAPSRASFFSGQYAHRHGLTSNGTRHFWARQRGVLEANLLPVWLEGAGYRTALIGKYSNGYKPPPPDVTNNDFPYVPEGWTDWYALRGQGQYTGTTLCERTGGAGPPLCLEQGQYSTYLLRDRAVAFIRQATAPGQTTPFFLLFTPKAVHGQGGNGAQPECADANSFSGLTAWSPPSYDGGDPLDFLTRPMWLRDNVAPLDPDQATHIDDVRQLALEASRAVAGPSPFPLPSPLPVGCEAEDDRSRAVQQILQTLREQGVDRDTVVIFTSDNGYFWGEHRLDDKTVPYDEAIRVPLIIRPAGARFHRTVRKPVLNIDLTATIAELAGITPLPDMDGQSLVPFLDRWSPEPDWRTHFLVQGWEDGEHMPTFAGVKSTVHGKYIEYRNGEKEYYALGDEGELVNKAADPAYTSQVQALENLLYADGTGWPPTEPAELIFASSFESGGTSGWSVSSPGPDLSVAAEARLGVPFAPTTALGLKVSVNDDEGLAVQDDRPQDEPLYRARFLFAPNSFLPGPPEEVVLFFAGEETPTRRMVTLLLRRDPTQNPPRYSLVAKLRLDDIPDPLPDDAELALVGPFSIDDAQHEVEFEWRKASGALPPDGYFRIWIDGGDPVAGSPLLSTRNDLDTDEHTIDFARLGVISPHRDARGTLYFDSFVSYRSPRPVPQAE